MSAERPQREVAIRLFAAEFEDSELTYAESDEERAPNYVVTPTGARANRVFVVGVLTEVERVNDDVLRARIVDPTGAFVVYAGQYQPEALAFFERTDAPAFVAVTGKARTFQPEDSDVIYTSVRPESANEVTAETRDRWVVQTAERTIDRLETFAGAVEMAERGDALADALERRGVQSSLAVGIPKAMDYYGTTTGYLNAVHRLALDATRVVANEIDEVDGLAIAPDEGGDEELEFDYTVPERPDDSEEPGSEEASSVDDQPTADAEVEEEEEEPAEGESEEEEEPAEGESEEGEQPTEAESEQGDQPADDEPEPDRSEDDVSDEDETESTVEASEATEEPTDETSAEEPEDVDEEDEPVAEPPAEGDELEESEEMYELSEEEREAVEAEYEVGFETGNEVGEPGEAGIETPDPEAAADESAPEEPAAEATEDAEAEEDAESEDSAPDDVDLEDRVVETMAELDDGDGAPRAEVVSTVAEEEGVSTEDVEAAIQDALMGGRCYEPTDDRITPI